MFNKTFLFLTAFLLPMAANASNVKYEYGGALRTAAGYADPSGNFLSGQNRFHAPMNGNLNGAAIYNFNDNTSFKLGLELKAKTGSNSDNLNFGHYGEEVYGKLQTAYGDFYVGQMQNPAALLGVVQPNLAIWQISPTEVADFMENPNWQQHNRRKYYSTLTSAQINTDGSSFKFAYFTPEFAGTTLALGFTPENNANDGLTSKFSPYYNRSAYHIALYNSHEFGFADTEFYLAYADFNHSHREYAGGISVYRRGLTLFAAYRQTESYDHAITDTSLSANLPAYYDAFRNGFAVSGGASYEFALLTSALSYFEAKADNLPARTRLITLHNSIKPYKHLGFYLGGGYAEFTDAEHHENRGPLVYGGLEISF